MTRIIQSRQHLVERIDYARYHGAERELSSIELICMHATGGAHSFAISREWLNRVDDGKDKAHPGQRLPLSAKASYNYGIERDGRIERMLPPTIVAYSQGDSAWPNPKMYPPGNGGHSINAKTLSIAWANDDKGEPLTEEQVDSALWLCLTYMQHSEILIGPSRVIGHYECSPGRKPDPKAAMDMRTWRQMLADARIEQTGATPHT